MKKILFNKPSIFKNNLNKLNSFSDDGIYKLKCEKFLTKTLKVKKSLLTSSCTAALEISAILLNTQKGDEFIMPSYTFVSTANAFVKFGGTPVFVDIDTKTMNINYDNIEKAITKKTKAIVVVHYAGISCNIDKIVKLAKKYKLYLIEDAAHSFMSKFKKKTLGSFGDLSTLSFHETKNIHCGHGGALLINNQKFVKRASRIRDKGTNKNDFQNNLVKKYTWVDYGSSYSLSEINSCFLYSQLLKARKITKKRREIFSFYQSRLKNLSREKKIQIPFIPENCFYNGHIYYLHVKKGNRVDLIKYLKKRGISSVFHYVPLHSSPFGKKKCKTIGKLLSTTDYSNSLLRLPMHNMITKNEVKKVCEEIENFFSKLKKY